MYDLRRLRSLCAIAEHGSLTAAADSLSFTQPAVSQHLAALEAEVGAPLVTRSRGGAELTAAGRLLVEHARAALARLVPLAMAGLRRRLPDAAVTIREAGPPAALAALRRGELDVELCRDAGFEPRIAFESDDPLATRGIVGAGLAVSLVPSLTKDDTGR